MSASLNPATDIVESFHLTSITLWYYFNRINRLFIMRFSPNSSPNTPLFGNVKMLLKFRHHSQRDNFLHVPSFWNLKSSGIWKCLLQASCGLTCVSRSQFFSKVNISKIMHF